MIVELSDELLETKAKLLGSLLLFTKTFYKLRTGREFHLSNPESNESHFITICRALTDTFKLKSNRLMINVPPGWGKSELCRHFIAWAMAHYPDCQFIYVSFSMDRAEENTGIIKNIMEIPEYKKLFCVHISRDSASKSNFKTTAGGTIRAFGSDGGITGSDAGLPNLDRFSGGIIMDDMHKPDEVHSDTIRERVIRNYQQTLEQRCRGINVPIIGIMQRLHESDLSAFLLDGGDGYVWDRVIIKAIDDAGNAVYPEKNPLDMLLIKKEKDAYTFFSQYQQTPQPSGGSIFKYDDFFFSEEEPDFISTFITCDTAETSKRTNDPTVFSFWGYYKIHNTEEYGVECIDCNQIWVEPSELEIEFADFYAKCARHPVKPSIIAIEKKSTGVTLLSVLKKVRGLKVLEIERTAASGSKTVRFNEMQNYIARQLLSLPKFGRHTKMFVDHMLKITRNDTHAHDDIADTAYDAIKLALIDRHPLVIKNIGDKPKSDIAKNLLNHFNHINAYRARAIC
jgi:predicted phage terminase large subunit-like protein